MPHFFLSLFRKLENLINRILRIHHMAMAQSPIQRRREWLIEKALRDATRAHYRRESVPLDEAIRALDGDTSVPKRPSVYVEGL